MSNEKPDLSSAASEVAQSADRLTTTLRAFEAQLLALPFKIACSVDAAEGEPIRGVQFTRWGDSWGLIAVVEDGFAGTEGHHWSDLGLEGRIALGRLAAELAKALRAKISENRDGLAKANCSVRQALELMATEIGEGR